MQRIGEALSVNKATISRVLGNCCTVQQLPRTEKRGRPKAEPKPRQTPALDKARRIVKPFANVPSLMPN